MDKEAEYLIKAVEEANCSIVVMQYTKNVSISRTKVVYISKNTEKLGLNMNAIRNGIRLPKDYIHPEDRPEFLDAVSVSQEVQKDFSNTLRVVGDDGTIHYVDVKAIYIDVDDKTYEVEYILREKGSNQVAEEIHESQNGDSLEEDTEDVKSKLYRLMQENSGRMTSILADTDMVSLFQVVSKATGLYSMVTDLTGKAIVEPVGPATHMGQFYDLPDRPFFGDMYEGIVNAFEGGEKKYYSEMDDGISDSRIAAVPIYEDGRFVATWILCAYDKEEKISLKKVYPEMAGIAEQISAELKKYSMVGQISEWEIEEQKESSFEIRAKDILIELLSSSPNQDERDDWSGILEKAGKLLDLDYVIFYKEKEGKSDLYEIGSYWSSFGRNEEDVIRLGWNREAFSEEERQTLHEEGYIVDHDSMTNRIRVGVFNGMARAAIIRPVTLDGKYVGRLVFFETRKERVWTEAEIHFTKQFVEILEKVMKTERKEEKLQLFTDALTQILNEFNVGILVKNRVTGKTIFANDFLNRKLGFDFTGMDSTRLVPTLGENAAVMGGVGSSTAGHWRRYINELGGIFDISSVEMNWADNEPAAVLILRVAQE